MALTKLRAILEAAIHISAEASADFDNPEHIFARRYNESLNTGSGDNQADQYWSDKRTLAAGASENLDLNDGSLSNGLGQTITLTKLKMLWIKNLSTVAVIAVGGAALNALDSIFADVAASKVRVQREDVFVIGGKCGTGSYAVDGTHKVLKIENEDPDASLTYEIVIVGID